MLTIGGEIEPEIDDLLEFAAEINSILAFEVQAESRLFIKARFYGFPTLLTLSEVLVGTRQSVNASPSKNKDKA